MLVTKLLRFKRIPCPSRRGFLSSEFKAAINPPDTEYLTQKSRLNFHEILELREANRWHLAPPLTSHLVVKSGIETSQDELLAILQNRRDNRIFLDNYTGAYLLSSLAQSGDHESALQMALDFQEEFTNELTVSLALKAIYNYLKDPALSDVLINPPQNDEKPEKKIRVKFLRNMPILGTEPLSKEKIGKTILNLVHMVSSDSIKSNMDTLGQLLCQQGSEEQALFKTMAGKLHKDVLDLCLNFTKDVEGTQELQQMINNSLEQATATEDSFGLKFDGFLKELAATQERSLIESQKQNFEKWTGQSKEIEEQSKEKYVSPLALNAKQIVDDLEAKKKLLWYFDNQDKIDLQIFQQQKVYRKKWFGKKKKPRMVHDDYIPPEVIKRA